MIARGGPTALRGRVLWIPALVAAALVGATGHAQTVAIVGGTVYSGTGPRIEHGTVLLRDGRIVAVGPEVAIPEGAQRIDASGRWVTPGFINSNTTLGVVEVSSVGETNDLDARGRDGIAASFAVIDGYNPASPMIPLARREGVTTVAIEPSHGLVAGQAALVDLASGPTRDVTLRAPAAMVARIEHPERELGTARGELLDRLRTLFDDVLAFDRDPAAYNRHSMRDLAAQRRDLQALVPVLRGTELLLIRADRASDIENALAFAREYRVHIAIFQGAEAWKVAPELAASHTPVLAGALNNIPGNFSTLDTRPDNTAILARAGVTVVLIGNSGDEDQGTFNVRNIRQEAGTAVANGLAWDEALRSITSAPAKVFGVADRVGTLRPGLEANVVVWSGDPFELSSRAEHVFVRGREDTTATREDLLTARYKGLPGR
jgi:imidazolonepropionase-like amidohydrolase